MDGFALSLAFDLLEVFYAPVFVEENIA